MAERHLYGSRLVDEMMTDPNHWGWLPLSRAEQDRTKVNWLRRQQAVASYAKSILGQLAPLEQTNG